MAGEDRKRFAYVFYATNNTYAVAVLVFLHQLHRAGRRADADIVLLHLPLSAYLLTMLHELGVVTRPVAALRYARGWHRDSLTKLWCFTLAEYERVVCLDADAMPLRSLDDLFTMPLDAPVAAPRAYWLPQPYWSTSLLVVRPSTGLWDRLARRFESAREHGWYDMEIVNMEFANEIQTLPAEVTCLDSEWEDIRTPAFFPDRDASFAGIALVHFTAMGKPWSYSPARGRRRRPHAHPAFHQLRERWWQARDEVFANRSRSTSMRYRLAASWNRCVRMQRLLYWAGRKIGR